VVLLDDPLSALDAGTAKQVFDKLIKRFFAETAVILVTHSAHFLNQVDRLIILVDGHNKFYGKWADLSSFRSDDVKTNRAVDFLRGSVQEEGSSSVAGSPSYEDGHSFPEMGKSSALMLAEEREYGLSSLRTWLLWCKRAGGIAFFGLLTIFLAIDRFLYVATEYWLSQWTQGAFLPINVFGIFFAPQKDGRSAQYNYLLVYCIILVCSALATYTRSEWVGELLSQHY